MSMSEEQRVIEHLARAEERTLLLDYDGTLVPIVARPELAQPDDELLGLLRALAARSDTEVHVVSGRPRPVLEAWLGELPIGLHAEHGYWRRHGRGHAWVAQLLDGTRAWMLDAERILTDAVSATPGAGLERKAASFAWHYRNATAAAAARALRALRSELAPMCEAHHLELLEGDHVIEVRPRRVHKGTVVREVAALARPGVIAAFGDDTTDEDMFAALPEGGVAVCCGFRQSRAPHRLEGSSAVRRVLEELANLPDPGRPWVLVVDDDEMFRDLVVDILGELPADIRAVPDVLSALEEIDRSAEPPALVLTDLAMPGVDGWGLVDALRTRPRLAGVGVLVMSAAPYGMRPGADVRVLRKPVPRETLLALASAALAHR